MNRIVRSTAIAVMVVLVAFLASCIVVPTAHKQTVGQGGFIEQAPELGFIRPGVTTRDEVRQKLGVIEVDTASAPGFWGRWTYQKWSIFAMSAKLDSGSLDLRHIKNLLIDFDANGVVTDVRRVSDRHLIAELSTWATKTKEPPARIEVKAVRSFSREREACVLRFKTRSMEVSCRDRKKERTIYVPARGVELRGLFTPENKDPLSEAHLVFITLHFPLGSEMGRNLTLEMEAADLYRLVEFTEHAQLAHFFPR